MADKQIFLPASGSKDDFCFSVQADKIKRAVVLDFGRAVSWIGFSPDAAREIARDMIEKADKLDAASDVQ